MGEGNQERNIMILFLSEVHYQKPEDRKIFNDVIDNEKRKAETTYKIYESNAEGCIETNEAPLRDILIYLKKKREEVDHPSLDAIFYFVSNEVKNCDKDGKPLQRFDIYAKKEDTEPKWTNIASDEEFFWTERAEKLTGIKFEKVVSMDDISPKRTGIVWRIPVAFNDDPQEDPVKSSTDAVRAMEEAIRKYLINEKVPWDKCNIYADTTGGFRTANMAMSAVIQLLVYKGATLRRVVYSEWKARKVSDVQPINDMYRLVAGVDAFRRYGSVAELDVYFEDVKSYAPLQKLLGAMNAFSEAVLLCQTNVIRNNLKELMKALRIFEREHGTNRPAKVEMFARMIDDLEQKYSWMFLGGADEPDELEIIQWCTNNSLIQQALTLCTEWLPEFLTDHGAVYSDVTDIQAYCIQQTKMDGDDFGKQWFFHMFLTNPPSLKKIKEQTEKRIIRNLMRKKITVEKAKRVLSVRFIEKFMSLWESIAIDFSQPDHNELLSEIMQRTVKDENAARKKKAKNDTFVAISVADLREEDVYKWMGNWVSNHLEYYRNWFGLPFRETTYSYNEEQKSEQVSATVEPQVKISWGGERSINAETISRNMFQGKMIQSDLPEKDALDYIRGYTYIRGDLRNKINHASKDSDNIDLSSVQEDIDEYLKLLRQLRGRKHVHTGLWAEDMKEATP